MALDNVAARVQALRAMSYDAYLATPEWRRRRDRALQLAGWRCEWPECHEKRALQVHHRSYALLGAEPDEDLRVLCARHHQGVHDRLDALRRVHWRVLRDVINSGPFAAFADFIDLVKCRFHAERIHIDWRDLDELLHVALRDVPIDVPRYAAHHPRPHEPTGPTEHEAREMLANLQISLTGWTMPAASWADPDQVTDDYEAARERAYEMGVELSLEAFLR